MTDGGSTQDGRRFSVGEAGEYIKVATRLQELSEEGLSYEELKKVAREVGVSEQALESAIRQADAEREAAGATADGATTDVPDWRSVGYRILEILCLVPPRDSVPR